MSQAVSLTGRYFNALCYLASGICLFVAAGMKGGGAGWAIALGVASILYGLYVAFTRGSYWVSTYTYLLPVVLVAVAFA